MGTILQRASRRADKETTTSDHIGSGEWRALISECWGAEVFEPVAETGLRYFETTSTLTTDGSAYLAEPPNFLSAIRFDYVDSNGRHYELDEITGFEQGVLAGLSAGGGPARWFAMVDNRIYVYPTPPTGQTYELLYIPQAPDVSGFADDQCIDLVNANGEACLYWGVAALGLAKAKQDASFAEARMRKHQEKLVDWAINRSLSQPRRRQVRLDDLDFSDPTMWDPAEYHRR